MPLDIISPDEQPMWIERVHVLLRWRRLVVGVTLAAWGLVLAVALVAPSRYRCVAMVSLPDVPDVARPVDLRIGRPISPQPTEVRSDEPGLPPALYRRLEVSLAAHLAGQVERPTNRVRDVRYEPSAGHRPTPPRPDSERRVSAIDLTVEGASAEAVRDATTALASWIRTTSATLVLLDRAGGEVIRASDFVNESTAEQLELQARREDLAIEEASLSRLAHEFAGDSGAKVVVDDDAEAGLGFLSLRTLLLGVRVRTAANERRASRLTASLQYAADYLRYVRAVEKVLRKDLSTPQQRAAQPGDAIAHLRSLLGSVAEPAGSRALPAVRAFRSDLEAAGRLSVQAPEYLLPPRLRERSHALAVATAMAVGLLLAVGVAFAVEAWSRRQALESPRS